MPGPGGPVAAGAGRPRDSKPSAGRSVLSPRADTAGRVTDGIIQGGFLFLILVTPLLFGSVYPWATSLIEGVAALMTCAWLVRVLLLGRGSAPEVPNRMLFLPAGLFLVLILFQAVPLPPSAVRLLSPETASLYSRFLGDLRPEAETTVAAARKETDRERAARDPARTPGESGTVSPAGEGPGADPFASARPLSLSRGRTQREGMLFLSYSALLVLLVNYKPEGSSRRFVGRIVACVAVSGALVAFVGILQKVLGATRVYGFWEPLQVSSLPIMGPYVNANHFAGYMELVLPPVIALFLAWAAPMLRRGRNGSSNTLDAFQSPENNKIALGLMGVSVMVVALFLSFSRAGVLSFLLSLFLLLLVLGRMESRFRPEHWRKIRRAGRVAFLLGFLLFGAMALSVFLLKQGGLEGIPQAARFQVWRDTLRMARDFPLFGTGLNSFSVISPAYKTFPLPVLFTHAENDYLQLLAETGLIGSGLVLLFFAVFVREVFRLFRWRAGTFLERARAAEASEGAAPATARPGRYSRKPAEEAVYPLPRTNYYLFWGCAGSVLSLALHSLADFNLHIPANGLLFFLLLGLTFRLVRLREPVFFFSRGRAGDR